LVSLNLYYVKLRWDYEQTKHITKDMK